MLFDLRGRRKNLVKVIYVALALLMGVGLVGFGIGGSATGGIADIFGANPNNDNGGNGGQNTAQYQTEAKALQAKIAKNPRDAKALAEMARTQYLIGNAQADQVEVKDASGQKVKQPKFTPASENSFRRASEAWERHLKVVGSPSKADADVAQVMTTAYAVLDDPDGAMTAAQVVSDDRPSVGSYLQVARFAEFAGDAKAAKKAADKALKDTPKNQRKAVENQLEQFRSDGKAYVKAKKSQAAAEPNPLAPSTGGSGGAAGGAGGGLGAPVAPSGG